MDNFYIILFLVGFFASMTILTTIQIVQGYSLSLQGLANVECQKNYHEYCFGEKWQAIVDMSDKIENMTDKLYSDESFLCKHKNHTDASSNHEIICIEIDDDDVKDMDAKFEQFQSDLDTFSINDIAGSNMNNMSMGDMK